jgi:hypothetical protein
VAFPTDWAHRVAITIESDDISADLTDWTLVFDQAFDSVLTQADGPLDADGSRASINGGGDVRFSSDEAGSSQLACDIRMWVIDNTPASALCEVAVKIPSVTSSGDTTIYMWWGKGGETQPAAGDSFGQYATYKSAIVGCWPLTENPTANEMQDRTSNQKHGDPTGGVRVTTPLGYGMTFDGSNDEVSMGDQNIHTFGDDTNDSPFSVTSLIYFDETSGAKNIFAKGYGSDSEYEFSWRQPDYLQVRCFDGDNDYIGRRTPNDTVTYDTWFHVAYRYDATEAASGLDVWIDGSEVDNADVNSGSYGAMGNTSRKLRLGEWGATNDLYGRQSEVRLYSEDLSDAWIEADYHNQLNTDGFLTWGEISDLEAFPVDWAHRVAITIESDDISADLTDWTLVFDQAFDSVLTQADGPLDADGSRASIDGGGDVRFSSDEAGETQLACDVRTWTTDNTPASALCEVAVLVPSVTSSGDTTIYMWWGKSGETQPAVGDTYGQYNAYHSSIVGCWSLSEDPTGGAGALKDRTSNQKHGTSTGCVQDATAPLGNAVEFDTDTDQVDWGDQAEHLFGNGSADSPVTLTMLFEVQSLAADNILYSKAESAGNGEFWARVQENGRIESAFVDHSNNAWIGRRTDTSLISVDTWYHHVCRYDATEANSGVDLWIDGSEVDTSDFDNNSYTAMEDTGYDLQIDGVGLSPVIDGSISEFRIYNVDLSDAWIGADYANQQNTEGFLTWGSIDDLGAGAAIDLTATIAAVTLSSTASLPIARPLETTIAAESVTSDADFNQSSVIDFTAAINAVTTTPDAPLDRGVTLAAIVAAATTTSLPLLKVIHALTSTVAAETTTSASSLAIVFDFTATIAAETTTPTGALAVFRDIAATIAAATTTSTPELFVSTVVALEATIAAETTTSVASLPVSRQIAATIAADTVSSDADFNQSSVIDLAATIAAVTTTSSAELTIAGAIELSATIAAITTASDANVLIAHALAAAIAAESTSLAAVLDRGVTLAAVIDAVTVTPPAAFGILNNLTATIAAESATSVPNLTLDIEFSTSIDAFTLTSYAGLEGAEEGEATSRWSFLLWSKR